MVIYSFIFLCISPICKTLFICTARGGVGDHNLGGGSFPVESKRRRAKEYTVPHNSRPGQRCASAKAELGDDLLTVVAVLPTRPFDFETRRYLRQFLSVPARKLRSRQYYRKIKTSDKPKHTEVFESYIQHEKPNLKKDWVKFANYASYKWGWNLKIFDDPSPDPRAVCIDVMFMVGDQRRLHSQRPRVPCCVGKPHSKPNRRPCIRYMQITCRSIVCHTTPTVFEHCNDLLVLLRPCVRWVLRRILGHQTSTKSGKH